MQEEIWRDVLGFEGLYQVSNLGNVKSLSRKICNHQGCYISKDKILKQTPCKSRGYPTVRIMNGNFKKSFPVHQMVAIAFLNHIPCGHKKIVDHIDNNKLNNNVDNLQIISNRENASKDKKNKTSKYTGVSWDKARKLWCSQIYVKGNRINLGYFTDEHDAHLAYQNKLKSI